MPLPISPIHAARPAAAAVQQLLPSVLTQAWQAADELPTMLALPPPGAVAYPYGDMVPLSFTLLALEAVPASLQSPDWAAVRNRLREAFAQHRQGLLWAFHATALPTSVDSAFVLRAVGGREGIEALEQFAAPAGGYYPQHFTTGREKDKMTVDARTGHWCQADYTILAQVVALRARAGLAVAPGAYEQLRQGFERRGGLYLASPHLADWLLADALGAPGAADAPGTAPLADALAAEVLAALADPAARQFDRSFATALAVSALARLGRWAPAADAALAELLAAPAAAEPPSLPFYSSMNLNWGRQSPWDVLALKMADTAGQLVRVQGEEHGITFYQDSHGLMAQALRLLALAEVAGLAADACQPAGPALAPGAHSRYRCATPAAYVAQYALPPYLTAKTVAYV